MFTAEVVRGIACAVTRTTVEGTPAGGWEPSQRLTVEAALRHFTRDAAFAEHAEQEQGTLAHGQARRLRRPLAGPPGGPAGADQGHEGAPDRARRPGHLARDGVLMAVYAGKVVVVTGASQGIGKALCLELAAQRPRLVLAARDAAALEAVAADVPRRAGRRRSSCRPTWATRRPAARSSSARSSASRGVDVLVNNAGMGMLARFEDVTDLSLYERLMRVNYLGSVYPTFYALPHLKREPRADRRGLEPGRAERRPAAHAPTPRPSTRRWASSTRCAIELRGHGRLGDGRSRPTSCSRRSGSARPGPTGGRSRPRPVKEAEIMSAEECARLIVRAMERRQRMLVMTLKGKLGRWAKLVAPGLVDRMAAEAVRKGK